jgi:hypothetical protein
VRALGIEDRVGVERLAPDDARLVVDTKGERVLLDGVVMVMLGESGYRLIRVLAEHQAKGVDVVPTRVTDKAISGARQSEGATRNIRWKLSGWTRESFAAAGRKLPEDLPKTGLVRWIRPKGWALTVKAAIT